MSDVIDTILVLLFTFLVIAGVSRFLCNSFEKRREEKNSFAGSGNPREI